MNRREFLQSLAWLGASISLPLEALSSAPESQIDQAWAAAQSAPTIFYVSEFGALSIDPVETYPGTRKELLDYQEVANRDELSSFAWENSSVASVLECELSDPRWFDEDQPVPDCWEDWLESADDNTIEQLIQAVNDWINDSPDESDYERADLGGISGRGYALRFFSHEYEVNEILGIVVVEGDRPGSSYFAAELRKPIDEANRLAEEEGIPIRFAVQG